MPRLIMAPVQYYFLKGFFYESGPELAILAVFLIVKNVFLVLILCLFNMKIHVNKDEKNNWV